MYGRMDGWMDGRTDGRTDGRMDGRTDGRTHGETHERTHPLIQIRESVCKCLNRQKQAIGFLQNLVCVIVMITTRNYIGKG